MKKAELNKRMKQWDEEIALYHRIRTTAFSYHRVGKMVLPSTNSEVKKGQERWKRILKIRKSRATRAA